MSTFKTLALAAALMGAAVTPSLAEGFYVAGPTAQPLWTQAGSRTPLASPAATQGNAALNLLERSGATGNGGQHQ
ncbi:hypothetical protein J8J14_16165 [Roseomonas sp. SSH11]|uniref:Uncharacterized protein n=1 Tax=Pararoseomonas baculiformis TaxID=2820812 RepID=A0ABS4AH04_9PROT|nr:hypothetical protein [Pararoseomonas baculiformis]MBP0446309.1 hypothetical protein [Pararoseomonas baculiformis]